MNLTYTNIIDEIKNQLPKTPRNTIETILKTALNVIKSNIKHYDINLRNFGTFYTINNEPRTRYNFQTKEPFLAQKSKSIKFKPSKAWKLEINNKK